MVDWSNSPQAYLQLVRDFVQMAGIKNGSLPILKRKEHPEQWKAWYAYYKFRRLHASMAIMREKDEKTVPTLSPFDFDAAFNPIGNLPDVPRDNDFKPVHLSPEAKWRMQRLYAQFSGRNFEDPSQAA